MKNLLISLKITVAFCLILFVGYILILWGAAAIISPNQGEAELLTLNGKVVGATHVGQSFTAAKYFNSRPSAVDYNGSASGGSNKGISNSDYLQTVSSRIDTFLLNHPYLNRSEVPAEMVTASGSGLDPHISVTAARVQAKRVAIARNVSTETIEQLIIEHTEKPLIGMPIVHVLKINIALDEQLNNVALR